MKQQLVLTILGSQKHDLIEKLTRAIRDSGASIVDSRMGLMGNEYSIMMLLSGPWDSIAKIEGMLPKLEKELDAKISSRRTGRRPPNNKRLPYTIELVTSENNGVIHEVVKFLMDNHIDVCELYSNSYQNPYTDMVMFSMHMVVNIPADSSISAVRSEFMEFCDRLNLDAVMEPAK